MTKAGYPGGSSSLAGAMAESHKILEVDLPCKWMLAGEYAVLSPGGMALAVAVRPGFVLKVDPDVERALAPENGGEKFVDLPPGPLPRPADFLCDAFIAARHFCRSKRRLRALRGFCSSLTFVSPELQGPRAGTSAALSVGMVWAVNRWLDLGLSVEKMIGIARRAHAQTQGRAATATATGASKGGKNGREEKASQAWKGGSGYDVNTIGLGGLVLTRASARSRPEARPGLPGIWLVCARAKKKTPTTLHLAVFDKAMASPSFRQALAQHVKASNALVRLLWEWADRGEPASRGKGAPDFGELAARVAAAETTLRRLSTAGRLGVFSREVISMLAVARAFGIPARVSGGGGGDAVVAFASGKEPAERLSAAFAASGWPATVLAPDSACEGPETLLV